MTIQDDYETGMMSISSSEKSRLRWQCRRGMLELDLFLLNYFDDCFDELTSTQQQTFAQLLKATDDQLFNWCLGREVPNDQAQADLIERIRAYAQETNTPS